MAKVGAQRAAELTGRSKSTVQRAMKSGKLSYEVDANDRRVIDVSELDRVFGLIPQESDARDQRAIDAEIEKATQMMETERLKMRIRMLEDQLDASRDQVEDLKEQRDLWQKQAQQTLLTSQYSQKQAEELKEELKERERRARLRRQQMEQRAMEQRMKGSKKLKGENENKKQGDARSFDIQGFWQKIKGPVGKDDATPETETLSENGESPVEKEQATG